MFRRPKFTVHSFTNGAAILQFGDAVDAVMVNTFREMWEEAWKDAREHNRKPVFAVGSMDVEVIEHQNPLGEEVDFDAVSHAFGALGEYKEDEEIEAFVEALRSYYQ